MALVVAVIVTVSFALVVVEADNAAVVQIAAVMHAIARLANARLANVRNLAMRQKQTRLFDRVQPL